MAKGSPLMGTQVGKLGESVLYRSQGSQQQRAYVRHISNPQSGAQQFSRMVVATISQAYQECKPICDHSFENVQPGQKSMEFFLSRNVRMLRDNCTFAHGSIWLIQNFCSFAPKGYPVFSTNPLIISRGSLPEIKYMPTVDAVLGNDPEPRYVDTGCWVRFPLGLPNGEGWRWRESMVNDVLIYNDFKVGDMLTFVGTYRLPFTDETIYEQHFCFGRFTVVEYTSLHGTVRGLALTASSFDVKIDASDFYSSLDNYVWEGINDGTVVGIFFKMADMLHLPAGSLMINGGWIHSRPLFHGRFLRSNCQLINNRRYLKEHFDDLDIENVKFTDAYPTWLGQTETQGETLHYLQGGSPRT